MPYQEGTCDRPPHPKDIDDAVDEVESSIFV
jgi:hypothetical protein